MLSLPSTETVVGPDGFAVHKLLLHHAYPFPQIRGVSCQNALGTACYTSSNKAWAPKTHGLGLDGSLVSAAQASSEDVGKGSAKGSCTPSQEASLAGRAVAEHRPQLRSLAQHKEVQEADGLTQESLSCAEVLKQLPLWPDELLMK